MKKITHAGISVLISMSVTVSVQADTFFYPLVQSAAVASPNHINELSNPWQVPAGLRQMNLTSMAEIEADVSQSVGRALGAGRSAAMFDMLAYDDTGRYLFIPHESPWAARVTRYDMETDTAELIFVGDGGGISCESPEATAKCEDWSADYAAFDPARYTPNGTLFVGEEWSGEGRLIEIMNPLESAENIQARELESIANVAHEGINFSEMYDDTIYYVDEWRSGSIYKFVMTNAGDYTAGQTFVLSVDAFNRVAADYYSDETNTEAPRTGAATWIPLTDASGSVLPGITDPFRNGPTNDPRENADTRGGRVAADDVGATPYGRPEDMEVGVLGNGNEVVYFTATSESAVYAIEILSDTAASVMAMVTPDTLKNEGFAPTTGVLNSPGNLAKDADGNLYIIEDSPNSSDVGGDIWFIRDTDDDGVAESIDHFMSLQVDGSEATGMIFNPMKPDEFVVAVQHPDSTDLAEAPEGFGDAIWKFNMEGIVSPMMTALESTGCDYSNADQNDGWGWDAGAKMSCPPASNEDCDYTHADQNGGWGWNPVTSKSCSPG